MRRPRLPRDRQKELQDDARLVRAWRKWHREELGEALAGVHGPMVERLVYMLKALELSSAPLLLAYIRGVDWSAVDYLTRLTVLHEVNTAITRMRERNGLSAIRRRFPGRSSERVPDDPNHSHTPRKRRRPEPHAG